MKPDFLIIPRPVYESKDLTHLDQKVYAVIYWYSKLKEDKCIASNNAIAEVVGSGVSTIREGLTRLEKYGFIRRVINEKNSRLEIIPLVAYSRQGVETENRQGGAEESSQKEKDVREDNIILTYNVHELPKTYGSTGIKRVLSIYNIFWRDKFGMNFRVLSWGKVNKTIKSLLSQYSEYQIALLMSIYFETQDTKEYRFLSEKGFPIEFLLTKHNIYAAYATNALGINMGDIDSVKKHVDETIKQLGQI